MATKLKGLKVRKVDFVDEGANPDAHIKLFKSKEGLEPTETEHGNGVMKKFMALIAKAVGLKQDEIQSVMEEIEKSDAVGFGEKMQEAKNQEISQEIWDMCYALQASLWSILNDSTLDEGATLTAMRESVNEFYDVARESVKEWAEGKKANISKTSGETAVDIDLMKSMQERLAEVINKSTETTSQKEEDKEEGDDEEMKIDKSKLTDAERAFLDSIEKRCGVEDGTNTPSTEPTEPVAPTEPTEPTVTKSVTAAVVVPGQQTNEPEDIYKGLHPAVAAEMEELRKFRESAEERELTDVAKKYEIIGKKTEDLVPLFKSLKAAGGTAYNDMIAVLDQAVETVEKSGVFSEIGKSGHGSTEGGAWAEAEAKAVELMKSKAGLSKAQALDEVMMNDPELAKRCQKEE